MAFDTFPGQPVAYYDIPGRQWPKFFRKGRIIPKHLWRSSRFSEPQHREESEAREIIFQHVFQDPTPGDSEALETVFQHVLQDPTPGGQ